MRYTRRRLIRLERWPRAPFSGLGRASSRIATARSTIPKTPWHVQWQCHIWPQGSLALGPEYFKSRNHCWGRPSKVRVRATCTTYISAIHLPGAGHWEYTACSLLSETHHQTPQNGSFEPSLMDPPVNIVFLLLPSNNPTNCRGVPFMHKAISWIPTQDNPLW